MLPNFIRKLEEMVASLRRSPTAEEHLAQLVSHMTPRDLAHTTVLENYSRPKRQVTANRKGWRVSTLAGQTKVI